MAYFKFNDKKIHYLEKRKGDLLLILPGNTSAAIAHQAQIDFFSQYYFVVSMDYLGTGQSERLETWDENWWEQSAEQAHVLINHLGKEQAIIVGTSGGAIVGAHLAGRYPQKVKALVLDSFSRAFTPGMFESNVLKSRQNPDEMQKQFWKYCHGEDWEHVVGRDTAAIKYLVDNGGDWLKGIHKNWECPALLTGSLQDGFLPDMEKEYKRIAAESVNTKIALSPGGAHPLIWTNPDFFYNETIAFLSQLT